MYRDTFTEKWDQVRRDLRREWSRLTDEDLEQIKGNVERLAGLVQQKYSYTKDQAQMEVTRFMDSHDGKAYQIARRLPGNVNEGVRRHPWAAVATAMGLGLVLGFLAKPDHASAAESRYD